MPLTGSKPPPAKSPSIDNNFSSPDDIINPPRLDPDVIPVVHSLIHLLQTYVTLSYEQLEFNMVPQHDVVAAQARSDVELDRTDQEGDTSQKTRDGGVKGLAIEG